MEEIACAICGESNEEEIFQGRDEFYGLPGQFSVKRCRKCDLGYISPRPSSDELMKYYPDSYYSFYPQNNLPSINSNANRWQKTFLKQQGYSSGSSPNAMMSAGLWLYAKARGEKLRIAFRPFPKWKPGGRLLDIGCGSGFYLSEMKKLGWEVHGVEYSEQAAATGRSLYGIPIFRGSLEKAPFTESYFDVITIWETLEHVPNPGELLTRANQLLRPHGCLLGCVPNRRAMYATLFGRAYFPWEIPRHLYHFSNKSLRFLAAKSGFSDIRIQSYSLGASNIILSWGIRKNIRKGKIGIAADFWRGKASTLRLLTWSLKPTHRLIDRLGLGINLEFELRKL